MPVTLSSRLPRPWRSVSRLRVLETQPLVFVAGGPGDIRCKETAFVAKKPAEEERRPPVSKKKTACGEGPAPGARRKGCSLCRSLAHRSKQREPSLQRLLLCHPEFIFPGEKNDGPSEKKRRAEDFFFPC